MDEANAKIHNPGRFPELAQGRRKEIAQRLAHLTLDIAQVTNDFARVERMPRYSDSRRESDVEHSYMLGLLAPEIAEALELDLDMSMVRGFALVHDLIEVKVGDVATFDLTPEQMKLKEQKEHDAKQELLAELPPETARLLELYEEQKLPEAIFVRTVDKLLPLAVDKVGDGVRLLREDYGVQSTDDLIASHDRLYAELRRRFGDDFPEVVDIYAILAQIVEEKFEDSAAQPVQQEKLRGPLEIELKYRVDAETIGDIVDLETAEKSHLKQGYVAIGVDGSETRVRSFDDERFEMTVKSPGMIERQEQTIVITEDMFASLWEQTDGRRVEKTRYYIPFEGHTIELDIYEGALTGLATAEVEFEGRSAEAKVRLETFVPPEWFGEDISKDPRYKNHNLSQGLPGEPHSMDEISFVD